MHIRSNLISATVLTGVLILSSCGGSDSSSNTNSGDTISKADFVEQANARCTALSEDIASSQSSLGSSPTEKEISGFMTDVLVVEYGSAISDIRDLGFPEGDEELLDGIFTEA